MPGERFRAEFVRVGGQDGSQPFTELPGELLRFVPAGFLSGAAREDGFDVGTGVSLTSTAAAVIADALPTALELATVTHVGTATTPCTAPEPPILLLLGRPDRRGL